MTAFLLAQADLPPAPLQELSHPSGFIVWGLTLCGICFSFLAGYLLRRQLEKRHFDQLFLTPWKPLFPRDSRPVWPITLFLSWSVTITGLVCTTALLLNSLQVTLLAFDRVLQIAGHLWLLLLTTLVALACARWIAAAVISIFDNKTIRHQLELMCPHDPAAAGAQLPAPLEQPSLPRVTTKTNPEQTPHQARMAELLDDEPAPPQPRPALVKTATPRLTESFADTMARLTGMAIYLMVFLPVFMIAAELWGWSATGSSLAEIWQWLLPFAGLTATVLVCWFGLTALILSFCPPHHRRNVMIATTILALILFTASYNTVFAIIVSLILLALVWLTRQDLPDAAAGLYLQMQSQPTVKTLDGPGRVLQTELLTSNLNTINGNYRVRNRYVLRSYLDGQIIEEPRMIKI